MSSPSGGGLLSFSSTITVTDDIPEPEPHPHDRKQSLDIIVDWDGRQDPDNPRKSVHVTLSAESIILKLFISMQLATPTQMGNHLCRLVFRLHFPPLFIHGPTRGLQNRF